MTASQSWILLFPVYNLSIADEIRNGVAVEQVRFLPARKIPRRLKAYPAVAKFLAEVDPDHLARANAFGILHTRKPYRDDLSPEFRRFRDAVDLLASSLFYRQHRTQRTFFGGPEFARPVSDQILLASPDPAGRGSTLRRQLVWLPTPYIIDRAWQSHISHHFFPSLLRILNGGVRCQDRWRCALRRAALCAGRSHMARSRWEAFMYDMIAIEVLLARRGDKFPDALITRLFALFGWFTGEEVSPWADRLKRLYQLRCDFVHDADSTKLRMADVIAADMLLANLLYNFCRLTTIFRSKDDVIRLAEQHQARTLLGQPRRKVKGMSIVQQSYSSAEMKELEKAPHWCW